MAGRVKRFLQKLNPIQSDIASSERGSGYPDTSVTAHEAQSTVGIVKRCMEVIADAASEVQIKVYRMDKNGDLAERSDNIISKFLHNPNEQYDRTRFFSNLIDDLITDGNAFIFINNDGMYHLPARYVEIIEHEKTFVEGYRYTANGSNKVYSPKNVIHVRLNNVDSVYRGISKLAPIEEELKIYKAMLAYQKSFFVNSGIPRVILKTVNFLNSRTKQRLLSDWEKAHNSLYKKANGTAILDGGLDATVLENSFKDLDFNQGVERLEQYIAVILGVPWVLLNSGNNANIRNNERLFYYRTVLPLMNKIASAVEFHIHKISPNMRGRLVVKADTFSIVALRPDMKEHAAYLSTLVNGGVLTPNEARKELRLEPYDGGDEIRIPANIAGSAGNPSEGGKPSDNTQQQ